MSRKLLELESWDFKHDRYGTVLAQSLAAAFKNFSAGIRPGGAEPPNAHLAPRVISESTRARKLKLKTVSYGHVLV